jgi:hypothetical protein
MIRSGLTSRRGSPAQTMELSSSSRLSATFNDFLFATVCEERNDMPLSVVSALARLNLDPWAEAAELSRMPAEGATRRLSLLLAGVLNDPLNPPDRATITARLVALLPRSPTANVASGQVALTVPQRRAVGMLFWLVVLASMAASLLMGHLASAAGGSGPASGPTPTAAARR